METSVKMLEPLVRRASNLYTLPAVAVDVLKLTNEPKVDVRALKECIECDPALTVKLLKVVNSSLFGLGTEVVDLNQALALLGTKTLKLLVLGFNLPDALFAGIASEQLTRYWSMSITRAVAAREFSRTFWGRDGDDAFIAGLLEDIGLLVLMKELGEPYIRLIDGVWKEEAELAPIEHVALGFDHQELSNALFQHWGLPRSIGDAIREPRMTIRLARLDAPHAALAQITHLAFLSAELIGRRRLNVLPDLLEAGAAYVGMTKPHLDDVIGRLDPMVHALADVFAAPISGGAEFGQILAEAHRRMANVAEDASAPLSHAERDDTEFDDQLLAEARALAHLSSDYLEFASKQAGGEPTDVSTHRFHAASRSTRRPEVENEDHVLAALDKAVKSARLGRVALSLLIFHDARSGDREIAVHAEELTRTMAFESAGQEIEREGGSVIARGSSRQIAVLPDHDRASAVCCAIDALRSLAVLKDGRSADVAPLCAGVASVAVVSKNFNAQDLLDAAERCVYAAGQSGHGAVKSIEIY